MMSAARIGIWGVGDVSASVGRSGGMGIVARWGEGVEALGANISLGDGLLRTARAPLSHSKGVR